MIEFPTRVTDVTVFPSGAKVTRHGKSELPKGLTEISLCGLPAFLDISSLQLSVRANVPSQILSVAEKQVHSDKARHAELERLLQALSSLSSDLEEIKANLEGNRMLIAHCDGLLNETRHVMFGLTNQQLSIDEHFSQVSQINQRREAYVSERKKLLQEYDGLVKQEEILKKQIAEFNMNAASETSQVTVSLSLDEASPVELNISYDQPDCGWNPIYRFNLAGGKLSLDYAAEVRQLSGEDWDGVHLSLATASHRNYGPLPELKPWFIQKSVPRPPVQPRLMKAMSASIEASSEISSALQLPNAVEAYDAVAEVEANEYSVNFNIPYPVSMASKDESTRVNIATIELPFEQDLLIVPKLVPGAFRRLKIHNISKYTLLPGQAAVISDGDYLGETLIVLSPAGSQFDLNFGIDDRVKVKRELISQEVNKKMFQERAISEYGYKITLTNASDLVQNCQLLDEIPVSRNDDVKVHLLDASPKPDSIDDLNRLTWNIALRPSSETVLQYSFSVEYQRDAQIDGLP